MKGRLAGLALGITIAFVLAELLALGAYSIETGRLFYLDRSEDGSVESHSDAETDVEVVGPGRRQKLVNRAHPFFGFVRFPDAGRHVNLQGFAAASRDYPVAKTDAAQYFIGVFGGSVATRFSAAASPRLIERLREAAPFRDRKIVVLNFASPGFKQPQQLLVLSYFLAVGQGLDMVINIDGFNEVALSRLNQEHGIDVAMPSADHILPLANLLDPGTLTAERVEALARIYRDRERISWLGGWAQEIPLAILWLVREHGRRLLAARLAQELLAYQGMAGNSWDQALFYVYPALRQLEDQELYRTIARLWFNSSLLMHEMLSARGIPYYHFLQPNQYYSKKVFGAAEATVALRENHPYRIGVEKGYPMLEQMTELLKRAGVRYFSALPIFDQEQQPIYKDDCCHLNQLGNDMLADFVADSILGRSGL